MVQRAFAVAREVERRSSNGIRAAKPPTHRSPGDSPSPLLRPAPTASFTTWRFRSRTPKQEQVQSDHSPHCDTWRAGILIEWLIRALLSLGAYSVNTITAQCHCRLRASDAFSETTTKQRSLTSRCGTWQSAVGTPHASASHLRSKTEG